MKMSPLFGRLATGISSNQMRERIQKELALCQGGQIELNDFHITRVFPRSDGSFTIQYQMNVTRGKKDISCPMILCGHLLGDDGAWPAYIESNKNQVMVFKELRLIVPVFPYDPKLAMIKNLCVRGKMPEITGNSVGTGSKISNYTEVVDFRVLGYRLEKRCVIKQTLGSGGKEPAAMDKLDIVTKIARPDKMKETQKCLGLLERSGFVGKEADGLTIADTYLIDFENGVQMSELEPGKSLHDLTGDKQFSLACEEAARILRKLHQIDSTGLAIFRVKDELARMEEKINLIKRIFPELSSSFESTYEAIRRTLSPLDDSFKLTCVHGDFYDKQILYSAGRSTLLDCDALMCGDPAQDYGNFVAHLILRKLQEPTNVPIIDRGMTAFKRVYGSADNYFEVRGRWWQAATLLRLAYLYSLRPKWHQLTSILLKHANVNLNEKKTLMEGVNENYHR